MLQPSRLNLLKNSNSKVDLARLLGIKASFLTFILYKVKPENQYKTFSIPKKNGGSREIHAPSEKLKDIQKRLSILLMDCQDEIHKLRDTENTLSHGFERDRSILTNALKHKNKKNILNIDLDNFFPSINFGRVRSYFIKNENFLIKPDIATVIAQIACFGDTLPQGSPCSPVISNLLAHSLDINLSRLASKNDCLYSRYADDISFSTREMKFPKNIVEYFDENKEIKLSNKLTKEISRAGFNINHRKTRLSHKNSRQEVTGLIVNKKINTRVEYWRTARAMCHSLFTSGFFIIEKDGKQVKGSLEQLDGILNFIDSLDKHNNITPKGHVKQLYAPLQFTADRYSYLNVREKTFSKFLFYKNFIANNIPMIMCEGKTDNIYLKCAIKSLSINYPELYSAESDSKSKFQMNFFNYTKRTRYLLSLSDGGSYLKNFISTYSDKYANYKSIAPKHPVVMIVDNDTGPDGILKLLNSSKFPNCPNDQQTIRNMDYLHICHNLYLILTPLNNGAPTMMESFFDSATLSTTLGGKTFSPKNDINTATTYGKHLFSQEVVKKNENTISFQGFTTILDRLRMVIADYQAKLLKV